MLQIQCANGENHVNAIPCSAVLESEIHISKENEKAADPKIVNSQVEI